MMLSIVGLKRAFMASGLILSIPCEDHLTKSTLWGGQRERECRKDTPVTGPGRTAVTSEGARESEGPKTP